jgi:hypothetical protein
MSALHTYRSLPDDLRIIHTLSVFKAKFSQVKVLRNSIWKIFLFLKIDFSLFYNWADYKIYFGVNKKNFSIIKKIEKL